MIYYRIYGRAKGNGRFKAIDLETGSFVGNLIYATYFLDKTDAENTAEEYFRNYTNF